MDNLIMARQTTTNHDQYVQTYQQDQAQAHWCLMPCSKIAILRHRRSRGIWPFGSLERYPACVWRVITCRMAKYGFTYAPYVCDGVPRLACSLSVAHNFLPSSFEGYWIGRVPRFETTSAAV